MDRLLRGLAPITDAAWKRLDREAAERLTVALGARKVVDFAGPYGWEHSDFDLGRVGPPVAGTANDAVLGRVRLLQPFVEVRAGFTVSPESLRDLDRGADDVDLGGLSAAALAIAEAENAAVFHGAKAWHIRGIAEASPHAALPHIDDPARYPESVASAVATLLRAGIGAPFALALSPSMHTEVVESSERGGYPLQQHLERILKGGSVVRVPGLRGAVVLSTAGGDFVLESGADFAIGYERHDALAVHLYLEESFTFRVVTPEAAVAIGEIAVGFQKG